MNEQNYAQIRRRLLERLAAVEIQTIPFPHFYLDDVFQPQELSRIVDLIRCEAEFVEVGAGMKALEIWKDAETLRRLPPQLANRLNALNCGVFTQDIAQALYKRFLPSLAENFQLIFGDTADEKLAAVELSDFDMAGAVNVRNQGSRLPAHIDWPNRLISLVVYLDADGGADESWGTRLYHVDRSAIPDPWANFAKVRGTLEPQVDIGTFTLIPFRHGRVAVFQNSFWSYHGAFITPTDDAARRWCIVKGINMTLEKTEKIFSLPKELQ